MPCISNARLSRWSTGVGIVAAVAACTGPQMSVPPRLQPAHRSHAHRAYAVVAIPGRVMQSAPAMRLHPRIVPIADEALQIGTTYANHETWQLDPYQPVDQNCDMLNWTYTNTIPGVTVTLNPTQTSLTGSTTVSFSQIPPGTPVQQWTNTITPSCSNTSFFRLRAAGDELHDLHGIARHRAESPGARAALDSGERDADAGRWAVHRTRGEPAAGHGVRQSAVVADSRRYGKNV